MHENFIYVSEFHHSSPSSAPLPHYFTKWICTFENEISREVITRGLSLAQTLLIPLLRQVSQSKTTGLTKYKGQFTQQFIISRDQIQLVRDDSYVYRAKKLSRNMQAQLTMTDSLAMRHSLFFSAAVAK